MSRFAGRLMSVVVMLALGGMAGCSNERPADLPADGGQPDMAVAEDGPVPDTLQPDVMQPDVMQPDAMQPDALAPDLPPPDLPPPDLALPDLSPDMYPWCGPGTVYCVAQGKCVDLQSDSKNCGACGTVCKAGEVCASGMCAFSCPGTLTKCGLSTAPYCASLQSDNKNCGACGTACKSWEVCATGKCGVSCPSGQSKCTDSSGVDYCASLQSDNKNCGVCGTVCKAGEICTSGACMIICPGSLSKCGTATAPYCANLQSDNKNCGTCGTVCKGWEVCASGKCSVPCSVGLTDCSGKCVDLQLDEQNCGACGTGCASNQLCLNGKCEIGKTCATILAADPKAQSGTYTLQPAATVTPFSAYCDMSGHHGGWILVAKLGASVLPANKNVPLTTDRGATSLANNTAPASTEYANWDMKRFDSFGSTWTVRTMVDSHNDGKHYQYTFYRPASGQTVLPRTAGVNWLGATTASKLLHLVMSTTTGLQNTTWMAVPKWDVCCGHSYMMFGYRLQGVGGQCLTTAGQTTTCHAASGGIINESNNAISGSYTAAFGYQDGVSHSHGRRATYWIKEVNAAGTP